MNSYSNIPTSYHLTEHDEMSFVCPKELSSCSIAPLIYSSLIN